MKNIDIHIVVIDTPIGMFHSKIICADQALLHCYKNLTRQAMHV